LSDKCDQAFEQLKQIVGKDIVLKSIDYLKDEGMIKLAVDSSFIITAGGVLVQQELDTGLDQPVIYKSLLFSPVESQYSQPKLELCGVATVLKKLQTYLWGNILNSKWMQNDKLSISSQCTNYLLGGFHPVIFF
jgi:hypothetical protein